VRTVVDTGRVVIGIAHTPPAAPLTDRDELRIQLLVHQFARKPSKPSPLLLRLLANVWRWL
jgi:hypothetical protein